MPRLLIQKSGEDHSVFELLGDRPVSIGRAKSSSVVLESESVSRLHAIVHETPDGRWQITDRVSSNGVKVNGHPVKEAFLRPNDEIVIGEFKLRFFDESAASSVVTYGTAQLPRRFEQMLSEPAYSGSFMNAQPLANIAFPGAERFASLEERVRALEHENGLLTLLYRVNRALSELNTVQEVTQRVLDLVLGIEGAERAFAMLFDESSMERGDLGQESYTFAPALIRHRAEAKAPRNSSPQQLTISQSIIRQVMKGGAPLLVTDAQADPRLSASQSVVAAGIRSAMCAPLGTKERRFGLLYVDNLSRRGMFSVDDLNVFAVIAVQAGLAIDRARAQIKSVDQPEPAAVLE
jgi:adenylate cyclase